MKKISILTLSALSLGLAGCGGDDGATNQSPVTQSNRPMSSMLDDVQSDRIALNQATNTQKANAEDPEHSYQQHSGM